MRLDPRARFAHRWRSIVEFARFSVVGSAGIGVNLGAYYALTRGLSLPLTVASPVAIELSILSNFVLNDRWTFGHRLTDGGPASRLLRFHVMCLASGAINYGVLLVATSAGWWDMSANLAGIAAGAVAKFAVSSAWIWRQSELQVERTPMLSREGTQ